MSHSCVLDKSFVHVEGSIGKDLLAELSDLTDFFVQQDRAFIVTVDCDTGRVVATLLGGDTGIRDVLDR
jgi:hypothetical protein